MRRLCAIVLVVGLVACAPEEPDQAGIRTRISVDRTETRVGDPIGVTIEVETPPDFAIEAPVAPGADHFFTDSIRLIEPIEIPGGIRHHLLWTVRAKEVGDAPLPLLDLGVVRPDGQIHKMNVGGVPLAVRSVRDALPARDAWFDIRDAPPPERTPAWMWTAAGGFGVFLALVTVALWIRRTRAEPNPRPTTVDLARRAMREIEDALGDDDPRQLADRLRTALQVFVSEHWQLSTASATPADLVGEIDSELQSVLQTLECARFERAPARAGLLDTARRARERLGHVANT